MGARILVLMSEVRLEQAFPKCPPNEGPVSHPRKIPMEARKGREADMRAWPHTFALYVGK